MSRSLPQASLEILLALAEEERHGYGIKRAVEERTGGVVRLGAGTLYAALERLLDGGLIRELDERPEPGLGSSRWRFYAITPGGLETLAAEVDRLERLVGHARNLAALSESDGR